MPVPQDVTLKDPSKFKIIGKPTKRLDTPEKVNGRAMFGLDVSVPGMLTALIARPPVFGAKVVSVNADKAKIVSESGCGAGTLRSGGDRFRLLAGEERAGRP